MERAPGAPSRSAAAVTGVMIFACLAAVCWLMCQEDSGRLARVMGGGATAELRHLGAPGEVSARDSPSGALPVPLTLDLMAAMLANGTSLDRSLECLARVAPEQQAEDLKRVSAALRLGVDWESAWVLEPSRQQRVRALKQALSLTALTGAGAAVALRAQAGQLRRRSQRDAQKRASQLGVRLVVPLGVCVLPAFLVLGVVPVIISVVPQLW